MYAAGSCGFQKSQCKFSAHLPPDGFSDGYLHTDLVYINCQFAVSRAGGDTVMGMLVDGIGNFGVVIPGIFLLAKFTGVGPVAMYAIIKFV